MTRCLPYEVPTPQARRARDAAAALLRTRRFARPPGPEIGLVGTTVVSAEPPYEFHAEAGAPEGALHVDLQRVGTLVGVMRL